MPLAIARFTAYDNHQKLLAVEQVTYEDDIGYFESEVSSALDCGVDVSVLSCHPIQSFKYLELKILHLQELKKAIDPESE